MGSANSKNKEIFEDSILSNGRGIVFVFGENCQKCEDAKQIFDQEIVPVYQHDFVFLEANLGNNSKVLFRKLIWKSKLSKILVLKVICGQEIRTVPTLIAFDNRQEMGRIACSNLDEIHNWIRSMKITCS